MKNIKKVFLILAAVFAGLVAIRVIHFFNVDRTNEQVAKIHATKLTLADVMGENLPPDPGALADKTLEGVDANTNGIRDDVELAIFETYPDSAKTRAALLQYALALQMQFTQPIVNTTVVDKVIGEQSRARLCIADSLVPRKSSESERSDADIENIDEYTSFIENNQVNNNDRKETQENFYEYLGNFANSDKINICDIDYLLLQN